MGSWVVDGRSYDRVHLIPNPDANSGFCALITYALNGVRMALDRGWLPVVHYDRVSCPLFYDSEMGEDVWEYYFEPVLGVSYRDVEARVGSGDLDPSALHSFDPTDVMKWHHTDPDRIATFWAKDRPPDPVAWTAEKRALGRDYVSRFVRVQPRIIEKVDRFVEKRFTGKFMFGAHVRGTDFAYAEPTPPDAYFREIARLAGARGLTGFGVFLATDQEQFVELFKQEYGSDVVTYEALRSDGETAPFRMEVVSPYRKGEDVLIDTLLMSRCDHLLKCAAAGGEYAMWFNPRLECSDFGLQSSFDTRDYYRLESAYLKLNVDRRTALDLRVRRTLGVAAQYLRTRRGVMSLPYRAWRIAQKAVRRLPGRRQAPQP